MEPHGAARPLGSGPATAADSWKLHQQFEAIKSSLALVTLVTVVTVMSLSKRPNVVMVMGLPLWF